MVNLSVLNLKVIREKDIETKPGLGMKVTTPETILEIAINGLRVHEQDVESFFLFTLDTQNIISGIFEVSRGSLNMSIIHPREIFKRAILQNANSIIVMHNHPSHIIVPSDEDIAVTKRLSSAGELLGIKVLDHIIVGSNRTNYFSFKKEDMM